MMVGKVLMPRLLDRFPKMSLAEPKKIEFDGFVFRGPTNLPVTLQ